MGVKVKAWTGSAWAEKPLKTWSGSAWVTKPVKYWNGTSWVGDTAGSAFVTWDAATVAAVTLSGGNLVATNTGTTATNQGAKVISTSGKTTGKIYFEITFTTAASAAGSDLGLGIGTPTSTYTGMGWDGGVTGVMLYRSSNVYSMGANVSAGAGTAPAGTVIGVAVDLDNRKIWFRRGASGLWNDYAAADPNSPAESHAISVPAGTMVPYVTFGGSGGVSGDQFTANFGASAFVGAVPSGYTSGWGV